MLQVRGENSFDLIYTVKYINLKTPFCHVAITCNSISNTVKLIRVYTSTPGGAVLTFLIW